MERMSVAFFRHGSLRFVVGASLSGAHVVEQTSGRLWHLATVASLALLLGLRKVTWYLPFELGPQTTRPVRGPQEYAKRIIDLLDFIPDFRAEPIEHATNGDVMFVRWIARGTGPNGPFEAVGVDRLIVPNGYVAENLILSDHPIFADFARYVGDLRGT
jgi:hypothetical protein